MFKSIRWKFITIYFLLVFIAMVIVSVFITQQFESQQMEQITKSMKDHINNIYDRTTTLQEDNWDELKDEIRYDISKVQLALNGSLYIINDENLEIVGSYPNDNYFGKSVIENKNINIALLIESSKGEMVEMVSSKKIDEINRRVKHIAYPMFTNEGEVKGIIYFTVKLDDIDYTMSRINTILIRASLIALMFTVILGFFLAKSITGPINDVTIKAEKMAKGDFDQIVEVKSDDEIGQLANMFNYLTQKLKTTISEVYREKSKMETTFNYMADGVVTININGKIIYVNPIALDILKLTSEEIENKQYDEVVDGLNEKLSLNYIKEKEGWEGNEIIELNNGIYSAKYAPFKNDEDEIGGLIFVFQDITEQHKLENMRREFVANVSHELKTPITTIKSYTETLLDGAMEDEDLAVQFLNVVNSESDRMARIVSDLLQLSNLDYKKTKWNKEILSVDSLLREIYLKMNISAKERKQKLIFDIEEDVNDVIFDKDGLEQVVLNIISNAIKYTPNGGEIQVIASNQEDKVIISVKDNGMGIPEEDLGRIFERFYRVDKARSREFGGTGLGLSIAKQIIEDHNGQIIINSENNIGTEVILILPIEQIRVI